MERNPVEKNQTVEKEKYPVRVTLFRHGVAKYQQGRVSIKEAQDLINEGARAVRDQAEKMALELDRDEEITIWCSPMGRTLETATIVADTLRERGFTIRLRRSFDEGGSSDSAESMIRIFQVLEEVRGLNIDLFSALIAGGSYVLGDGTEVIFEKNVSNPDNMSFQDYYYQQGYKKYLMNGADMPKEVRDSLMVLEEESDVHHRFDRNVERVQKISSDKKRRIIIVTHHVCMKDYSENEVEPAEYINIE